MEMDASRARKLQEEAIENVIIIALRLSGADILGPSTIDTSVVLQEAYILISCRMAMACSVRHVSISYCTYLPVCLFLLYVSVRQVAFMHAVMQLFSVVCLQYCFLPPLDMYTIQCCLQQ